MLLPFVGNVWTGHYPIYIPKIKENKNDNIHNNEVQQIRWSDEYWQYRVAANIKEYHIISKLILKSIGQFWHTYINKSKKPKIVMLKMGILTVGNDYRVVLFSKM